ncbi:hypothetical protein Salat_1478000 [Sesamum alatum]|uniref:CCHC-type domain-containing protein n=1 Tax=Sesamum alatum TaxID=300844 RepID=A0AAE1YB94_9LAMI|nr:hypothetical protein Salat_1478000 [Sesamum alatum]
MRVRLNISKPLLWFMKIRSYEGGEITISSTYERLPNFCYLCGKLGHLSRDCDPDMNTASLTLATRLGGRLVRVVKVLGNEVLLENKPVVEAKLICYFSSATTSSPPIHLSFFTFSSPPSHPLF